jgi:hypothetical protein
MSGWSLKRVASAAPGSEFANPMTAVGDIIKGGTSGAAGRLAIGSTSQVLTVVAGAPAWATPTPLGDLVNASNTNEATLTADIALTTADKPKQIRTPSASGWKITLTSALYGYYDIWNDSALYSFDLYQAGGATLLTTVAPKGSLRVTLKPSDGTAII